MARVREATPRDAEARGVGRELLAEGLGYLARQDCAEIMLWVLAGFRLDGGEKSEEGLPRLAR